MLQQRLGLPNKCAAFDINLGCSQFVYALSVAHSMIVAGLANRALVLTGDTTSRLLHPLDRALVPLMGDAGSATLLEAVPEGAGFLGFELGTDGSGVEYLMVPAGGARTPRSAQTAEEHTDAEGNIRTAENMFMNGPAVFHFVISVVPRTVQRLLAKLQVTMDDVDCILFHQANRYMIDYLVKKLKIPAEKTHFYIAETGNTSGSAMPGVLTDAVRIGKIKPNSLVVLVVFGVGLSWAATAMRWAGGPEVLHESA
jgi:3-oxoacyl-[acyl-carrier-protein] synthase-3